MILFIGNSLELLSHTTILSADQYLPTLLMFTPTLDTGMANKLQLSHITGILHYRVAVRTYVHKEYVYHRGTTSQGGSQGTHVP